MRKCGKSFWWVSADYLSALSPQGCRHKKIHIDDYDYFKHMDIKGISRGHIIQTWKSCFCTWFMDFYNHLYECIFLYLCQQP